MSKIAWIVLLAVLVPFAPAFAADPGVPLRDACREDVRQLCPDVRAGGGKIAACLQSQIDKVSPGCRTAMEEAKQKIRQAVDACRDDMQTFCPDIKPGSARIARCLKKNVESLTPDCRQVVERGASKMGK
jgi:hypothetical protein